VKPETFRKLAAAGLSHEQMALVLEIMDEQERAHSEAEEARKSIARDRVNRWRERHKDDVTLQKVTETQRNGLRAADAPVDVKQITNRTTKVEKKEKDADKPLSDLEAFKAEISPILDSARIDAICAVRRKKRAVFSAHAGQLLSKALLSCPDVLVAADAMILRNWTSVQPDWLAGGKATNSQAPPGTPFQQRHNAAIAAFDRKLGKTSDDEFTGSTLDLGPTDWRTSGQTRSGH
jgi:hypothetical protein